MTRYLFRGNPRILLAAAPYLVIVVVVKLIVEINEAHLFVLSPLLAGAIGAEVFILGFLFSGTSGDFKEAEKLPGELASGLESMADEMLIGYADQQLPEAKQTLGHLVEIAASVRSWLIHDRGLDDVLDDIRALNAPMLPLTAALPAVSTSRLKAEQSALRKTVLRMDTIRRTSYVAAGYLIAEITGLLLILTLLVTDFGRVGDVSTRQNILPAVFLTGLITYLLVYLVSLIRDLDNPFEYHGGKPGAADVNLEVLENAEVRLRAALAALDARA
jgi:hypothetical protein